MPGPLESLQSPTPSPYMGGNMGNPLQWMNQLTEFQNRMNQNRLFQAQFGANQALGEIMAHANSPEEGLQQVMQNPAIWAFGGEGLKNAMTVRNLNVDTAAKLLGMQETQQRMTQSASEDAFAASMQAAADPMNAHKYYTAALAKYDPVTRARIAPQFQAIEEGLRAKLAQYPNDPQAAQAAAKSYLIGQSAGHIEPSRIQALTGGFQFTPGGQPFRAPSAQELGGTPPGTMTMPFGAPAQAQGPGPTTVTNPVDPDRVYPVRTDAAKDFLLTNPDGSVRLNVDGQPIYRSHEMEVAGTDAAKEFGKDATVNAQARTMYSTLEQLHSAEKDLAERGGFTVQGPTGPLRGKISAMLETASNMGLISLDHEAELRLRNLDVGEITKQQGNLIFNLKNSLDPGARSLGSLMEAATVVPGMEQTPLTAMVLTAGLKGLAKWQAGEYPFEQEYLKQNRTLLGAKQEYSRATSPLAETRAELNKMGMDITPDHHFRFLNDGAVLKAFTEGLLGPRTKENIESIAERGDLFGDINTDKGAETYRLLRAALKKMPKEE